jgi:hypothetical protein
VSHSPPNKHIQARKASRGLCCINNSPQAVWSALLKATPSHSTHTARKPPWEKKPLGHLWQLPEGVVSP